METETETDNQGRVYAKLSELSPGDLVQVDDGFEGCFIPWSTLQVILANGELVLAHNTPECGACDGDNSTPCYHSLDGQLSEKGYLIGIYKLETPRPPKFPNAQDLELEIIHETPFVRLIKVTGRKNSSWVLHKKESPTRSRVVAYFEDEIKALESLKELK